MKKLVLFFLAIVMIFGSVACSSAPEDETKSPEKDKTETVEKIEETDGEQEDNVEETEKADEESVLKIPTKKLYFTIPSDLKLYEKNKIYYATSNDDYLVGIYCDVYSKFDETPKDILEKYSVSFLMDIRTSCEGAIVKDSLEVIEGENVKIGGFDAYKFTAKVANSNWDCYAYGYTCVVGNSPVLVLGLVHSHEQADQMIKDVTKYTDQIAASVRTEK